MLKKTTRLFTKKKGSSSSKAIVNNLLVEALGLGVSSEYGGGHGTAEEERYSSPWWHEGHTKFVYEVHQTSRTYGGAAHPTSLLDTFIRSTSICSAVFRVWIYHHDGGGGEEAHQQRNGIQNPFIQVFHSWMCKSILGRMIETKITNM
jgi:hypothetical protein